MMGPNIRSHSLGSELVLQVVRLGTGGRMKADFLLFMHGNQVFHPDGIRMMLRVLQSSLATGDRLWAGAAEA